MTMEEFIKAVSDDWIARLRACAENAACNCPVAPSQDPVSPIWHLYYCDPETGRDHLSQSGPEVDIRKAFASALLRGRDVWMIDPSGCKHLPSEDTKRWVETRNTPPVSVTDA